MAWIVIVLGLGGIGAAYLFTHAQSTRLARQNAVLAAQTVSLSNKLKYQKDLNEGVAPASEHYNDPPGGLALMNGAVTFNLPEGWKRTSVEYCTGGSRDSAVLCRDVAAITGGPNTPTFIVGVFDYSASDGDAKAWSEDEYGYYFSSPVTSETVNGYSAVSFPIIASDPPPAYVYTFDAVVHGKYAVVVRSQIVDGVGRQVHGNAQPFDYRKQYTPVLKQFVNSIRFRD